MVAHLALATTADSMSDALARTRARQTVLNEMRVRDITGTTTAYCFCLAVAAANFRLRRADALLSEMEAHGMLRGPSTHAIRIRATLNQLVRRARARCALHSLCQTDG